LLLLEPLEPLWAPLERWSVSAPRLVPLVHSSAQQLVPLVHSSVQPEECWTVHRHTPPVRG
jgi:hypothetical protein